MSQSSSLHAVIVSFVKWDVSDPPRKCIDASLQSQISEFGLSLFVMYDCMTYRGSTLVYTLQPFVFLRFTFSKSILISSLAPIFRQIELLMLPVHSGPVLITQPPDDLDPILLATRGSGLFEKILVPFWPIKPPLWMDSSVLAHTINTISDMSARYQVHW
jgi:hypothetical protein